MADFKKITILIPCRNEEKGIARVLDEIPYADLESKGYKTSVIVIDNNSTDRTREVATAMGASVLFVEEKGKGHAIQQGFMAVSPDSDYVVMLDGDSTYKPGEILRLIEPLDSNFSDVIIGSRLGGKVRDGALKFTNRVANWGYTFLIRQIYQANVTDVLSGYVAWKKEVVDLLIPHIHSRGFSIEIDLITKTVLLGKSIYSVPITYDTREGHSKVESFRDGAIILGVLFINLIWKPDIHNSRKEVLRHALRLPMRSVFQSFKRIKKYEKSSRIL